MSKFVTATLTTCILFAAGSSFAQDAMKKDDSMMKKDMTMQECKDHMTMEKKDGMKKDDAMMMKKHDMCADMMKKDGMKKDEAVKKDDGAVKKY